MFGNHSPYSNWDARLRRGPFGREIIRRVAFDKSLVLQAFSHLREHSPAQRKRWHRQIEAVLHRFARLHGQRRIPVRIGHGFVQVWWRPPKVAGWLLTDVQVLLDPAIKNFPPFESLLREISEIPELAELVIFSLIVRRDYRFRDFNSIALAQKKFDSLAPKFVRLAYEKMNLNADHIENFKLGNKKRKEIADARQEKIFGELRMLRARKTPRRHWTKLVLQALGDDVEFSEKTESARTRDIQRAAKKFLSTPDGEPLREDKTTSP